MKTLYIVRHGKSAWGDPDLKDHDRILLPKGIKKTGKIANFLLGKKIKPELLISSSAKRAVETAVILAKKLNYPEENIKTESNIYYQGTDFLFDLLHALPDEISSVMLVGHNPTFSNFANKFLDKRIDDLPTTGTVSVSFETDRWEDILLAAKKTNFVVVPKML